MGKAKANQFCPVLGCGTEAPHKDDADVQRLLQVSPDRLASWALAGMDELAQSISRDVAEKQHFAWMTRLRQVEELYVRTLYLLLIADKDQTAHMLSDAQPNGFTYLYNIVNKKIFGERGVLTMKSTELQAGKPTGIEIINRGAHVSFKVMLATSDLYENPKNTLNLDGYFRHIHVYCDRLDAMRQRFQSGSTREDVLDYIKTLHLSASGIAADQ